jgi:hypothetical protein
MDFFAVDRDVARRAEAEFHSVAVHCQYDQFDIVAYDDLLIHFATENKHGVSSVKQVRYV